MSFFNDFAKALSDKRSNDMIAKNKRLKTQSKKSFHEARVLEREAARARKAGEKALSRFRKGDKKVDSRLRSFFKK